MTEPNGFYYMRARYYDPEVGRFISEDPIGFEGGDVNLMAYVANNPVNGIDPSGLLNFKERLVVGMINFWKVFGEGTLYIDDMVVKPIPFLGTGIMFLADPTDTIVTQEEEMKMLNEWKTRNSSPECQ